MTHHVDISLLFPPQWSPFQPPLSIPSLAAWLTKEGISYHCLDLNLEFYYWLLSDDTRDFLCEKLSDAPLSKEDKDAYLAVLLDAATCRKNIAALQASTKNATSEPREQIVSEHFMFIKSLETYLEAVSAVFSDINITPYSIFLQGAHMNAPVLEQYIASPPILLKKFIVHYMSELLENYTSEYIGISCIGSTQLFFSLLLGDHIIRNSDTKVIIGGTVFSRIVERGSLPIQWFNQFFHYLIRNEGEKPLTALLKKKGSALQDIPGLVFFDGTKIVSNTPALPLTPAEIPIPDFDRLPLSKYFSAAITLPILSSRGCYWGKCEFCHHGMVYGEKYSPYKFDDLFRTIQFLSDKYGVKQFCFYDEAIPPKTLREIGSHFPSSSQTGWTFSGLIKFERYFQELDFSNAYRAGFRSLFIGLESASEKVLALMRKHTSKEIIISNLTNASKHGIWTHCYLIFGFPGETHKDAQETYDFIMKNSSIIDSFGYGTFDLEHNSPMFHHLEDFPVSTRQQSDNNIGVYYQYDVTEGINHEEAKEWANKLYLDSQQIQKYKAITWLPREHLLYMLSVFSKDSLLRYLFNEGQKLSKQETLHSYQIDLSNAKVNRTASTTIMTIDKIEFTGKRVRRNYLS